MASNSEKSANSFMPLYGGDYLRDTMHLSAAEDGIYLRLLMHYWHSQRPLPADQRKLEGIARVQDDGERQALKTVLAEFFPRDGEHRRNSRMDREIKIWTTIRDRKIAAGKLGGETSAKARAILQAELKQRSTVAAASLEPATATATATIDLPPPPPPESQKKKGQKIPAALRAPGPNGSETWEAYRAAYMGRYKVQPVRNATVNACIAQFVKRIGAEESPHVAAFYVAHNNSFYVRKGHSVSPMLSDAEKLRTEWATGRRITALEARHAEQGDAMRGQVERVRKILGDDDADR